MRQLLGTEPVGPTTDLTTWTERGWARAASPATQFGDGLSATQRLLLGLVAFGQASYRDAARCTGLTAAEVSGQCTSALRLLSAAVSRDDAGRVPDCGN